MRPSPERRPRCSSLPPTNAPGGRQPRGPGSPRPLTKRSAIPGRRRRRNAPGTHPPPAPPLNFTAFKPRRPRRLARLAGARRPAPPPRPIGRRPPRANRGGCFERARLLSPEGRCCACAEATGRPSCTPHRLSVGREWGGAQDFRHGQRELERADARLYLSCIVRWRSDILPFKQNHKYSNVLTDM